MITHACRWRLASAGTRTQGATTPVNLVWSQHEALAVRMDITQTDGTGRIVQWMVGRDLLATGLSAPAGEGDVRVDPRPRSEGAVVVTLGWQKGHQVHLATDADEIAAFLARTYEQVPAGAEHAHTDIDAALAELLGWG